jgi:hypothetical protein
MATDADIQQILLRSNTASVNELYAGIADALPAALSDQIGGGAALRIRSPIEFGKEFYQRKFRPGLITVVCGRLDFCANRKIYDTAVKVAGIVADAAGEIIGKSHGIPAGSGEATKLVLEVSAAALKEGLNELCDCTDE